MNKIINFTSKKTFKCLLCNENREFKGTMYNAKDHVAAAHKQISDRIGLSQVHRIEKLRIKKPRYFKDLNFN